MRWRNNLIKTVPRRDRYYSDPLRKKRRHNQKSKIKNYLYNTYFVFKPFFMEFIRPCFIFFMSCIAGLGLENPI